MQLFFSHYDYWVIQRALVDSNAADLERARLYREQPGGGPHAALAEVFEAQAALIRRVLKDLEAWNVVCCEARYMSRQHIDSCVVTEAKALLERTGYTEDF